MGVTSNLAALNHLLKASSKALVEKVIMLAFITRNEPQMNNSLSNVSDIGCSQELMTLLELGNINEANEVIYYIIVFIYFI